MARTRKTKDKDVITRLAGAGEDALQRLGELPGGKAVLESMTGVRDRLDDVVARLRALDPLEKRVASLEKRLSSLEKPKRSPARRTTARKTTATRTTAKKTG